MRRLRHIRKNSVIRTLKVATFWLSAAFLLAACSGTPSSLTYYLLHSPAKSASSEFTSTLVLNGISLPEYLKQRGLVYQISDTNLHISTKHLWAEPVEAGLSKALSHSLASHNIRLVRKDHFNAATSANISLYINDFVSSHTGEVIFSGEYVITSMADKSTITPFHLRTNLSNDGFSASIDAMREAVDTLSAMIAKDMNQ